VLQIGLSESRPNDNPKLNKYRAVASCFVSQRYLFSNQLLRPREGVPLSSTGDYTLKIEYRLTSRLEISALQTSQYFPVLISAFCQFQSNCGREEELQYTFPKIPTRDRAEDLSYPMCSEILTKEAAE
jgi:hypothetical protein